MVCFLSYYKILQYAVKWLRVRHGLRWLLILPGSLSPRYSIRDVAGFIEFTGADSTAGSAPVPAAQPEQKYHFAPATISAQNCCHRKLAFSQLKIHSNVFAARAPPRIPLAELSPCSLYPFHHNQCKKRASVIRILNRVMDFGAV